MARCYRKGPFGEAHFKRQVRDVGGRVEGGPIAGAMADQDGVVCSIDLSAAAIVEFDVAVWVESSGSAYSEMKKHEPSQGSYHGSPGGWYGGMGGDSGCNGGNDGGASGDAASSKASASKDTSTADMFRFLPELGRARMCERGGSPDFFLFLANTACNFCGFRV